MASKKKEDTKIAAKDNRRGFLRAAAVGVAGVALTAGKAAASGAKTDSAPMRKAGGTPQLSPAEHAKDVKLQDAAKLLKDIDANIEIVWVKRKGNTPAARRIIQMEG